MCHFVLVPYAFLTEFLAMAAPWGVPLHEDQRVARNEAREQIAATTIAKPTTGVPRGMGQVLSDKTGGSTKQS